MRDLFIHERKYDASGNGKGLDEYELLESDLKCVIESRAAYNIDSDKFTDGGNGYDYDDDFPTNARQAAFLLQIEQRYDFMLVKHCPMRRN
ncbi:hypothetical protein PCCS19_58390 [Paenibacillus sp. CCS19]|nr:hypothetical protein PCCS19_58390 [Paenibacillus cellulosilyticus]